MAVRLLFRDCATDVPVSSRGGVHTDGDGVFDTDGGPLPAENRSIGLLICEDG